MIAAAGRCFRRKGFGGIGVDGLAREAEVTSGAFYGHFPSKDAAFKEAVAAGIEELRAGIEAFQEEQGDNWVEPFVDFYLGSKRTCDLGESCAMQSLSAEVARSKGEVRSVYQNGMLGVVEQVARGLRNGSLADRRARAWAFLSILAGGVTLARATSDPKIATMIAKSIKAASLTAIFGK
jgi:TetR/AcrR family transcriptional regulator, transcriptional repressor for nem operon